MIEEEPMNLFFQLAVIIAKNPKWDAIEKAYGPDMVDELRRCRIAFGINK
jgi:hypothetical protein